MRYSAQTGNFYPPEINYNPDKLPSDLIDVSPEEFAEAMNRGARDSIEVIDGTVKVIRYEGPTLEEARTVQIDKLIWQWKNMNAPQIEFITSNGDIRIFSKSEDSRNNLIKCRDSGKTNWNCAVWLDINNRPVYPFSYSDITGLLEAIDNSKHIEFVELLTLIARVIDSTTIEGVQSVDWK